MIDSRPPVVLFGAAHLTALVATLALAAGLSVALRRLDSERFELGVRAGLSLALLGMLGVHFAWIVDNREVTVWEFVPLDLCELSVYLSVFALATKKRVAAELLYFWTCSGTFLAMVLPAIDRGFPSLRFFIYFTLHGGIIVAAVVLIYGLRLYPDRRSPHRAFGFTLIYAAAVGLVDLATGQNYLFLAHKPDERTLLDYLGPWPIYIFVALALGFAIFLLLALPFRGREPGAENDAVSPHTPSRA